MTTRTHNTRRASRIRLRAVWWCSLAALAWATTPARAQDDDGWAQHLRLALPVTVNVKARFTENGTFGVPAGAAGQYNDGYVLPDQTGDLFGQTGNWGYQSASQYSSVNNTLTMHSATSYTANGSASKDFQPFLGIEAAYGTDLWKSGPVRVGWEIGAGFTPLRATDDESLSSTVTQNAFTFSTAGIAVMPAPGYQGGPSGISEPTISDTPSSTNVTTAGGMVTGARRLDLMLYTLRLGPTVAWDLNDQFTLMGGVGPAVGLLNGNYDYSESVVVTGGGTAQNSGRIRMTKAVYGGYVNGQIIYHAIAHGDVYLGAEFMPLSSASVSGMGRTAKVDLSSAMQFSIGLNWPF